MQQRNTNDLTTGKIFTCLLKLAGQTMATMIFTVTSLRGLQVPLALFLSRVAQPATQGIWWAIGIAMTFHALMVTGWF